MSTAGGVLLLGLYTLPISLRNTTYLDSAALERIVEEQGLKHWLLARLLGVDRKTVYRWLTGQTKRISLDHMRRLTMILGCGIEELQAGQQLAALATRKDRWEAARRMKETDLIELIAPSGDWGLAESLLRSLLDPAMPVDVQANLYLQMAIVQHYLMRYDEGRQFARQAIQCSSETGQELIALSARSLLAVMEAHIGSLQRAREQCLLMLENLPADYPDYYKGPIYSIAGWTLCNLMEYEQGLSLHRMACDLMAESPQRENYCRLLLVYACALVELSDTQTGLATIDKCIAAAREGRIRMTELEAGFIRAELLAAAGRLAEAVEIVEESLPEVPEDHYVRLEAVMRSARVLRVSGNAAGAAELINVERAWENSKFDIAQFNLERARVAMANGAEAEARRLAAEANEIFRQIDADVRLVEGLPGEAWLAGTK